MYQETIDEFSMGAIKSETEAIVCSYNISHGQRYLDKNCLESIIAELNRLKEENINLKAEKYKLNEFSKLASELLKEMS